MSPEKLVRSLAAMLIAVLIGVGVFRTLAPYLLAPASSSKSSPALKDLKVSLEGDTPTLTQPAQNEPRKAEAPVESLRGRDLEQARTKLYREIVATFASAIGSARTSLQDDEMMEIFLLADNADIVPVLVENIVEGVAEKYQFRRVAFFVPNPAASDRSRMVAEVGRDDEGRWVVHPK